MCHSKSCSGSCCSFHRIRGSRILHRALSRCPNGNASLELCLRMCDQIAQGERKCPLEKSVGINLENFLYVSRCVVPQLPPAIKAARMKNATKNFMSSSGQVNQSF